MAHLLTSVPTWPVRGFRHFLALGRQPNHAVPSDRYWPWTLRIWWLVEDVQEQCIYWLRWQLFLQIDLASCYRQWRRRWCRPSRWGTLSGNTRSFHLCFLLHQYLITFSGADCSPLEKSDAVLTSDDQLSHVTDIENGGTFTAVKMLLGDPFAIVHHG